MADTMGSATTSDQGPAVGVVETDLFCEACGFNLHTQRVWRDPRLGLLVARCPECATHHAVSTHTSAGRNWVQRLALLGLLFWSAIALSFIAGVFGLSIGIYVGAEEGLLYRSDETIDGQFVTESMVNNAMVTPVAGDPQKVIAGDQIVNRMRLTPLLTGRYPPNSSRYRYGRYSGWPEIIIVGSLLAAAWLMCSTLLAAGSWFWPRRWRAAWLVMPILSAAFVYLMLRDNAESQRQWNPNASFDLTLSLRLLAVMMVLQVATMAIGLQIGRPFCRFLLTVLIPPKSRQLFAFLWHCDGKSMPSAGPEKSTP